MSAIPFPRRQKEKKTNSCRKSRDSRTHPIKDKVVHLLLVHPDRRIDQARRHAIRCQLAVVLINRRVLLVRVDLELAERPAPVVDFGLCFLLRRGFGGLLLVGYLFDALEIL